MGPRLPLAPSLPRLKPRLGSAAEAAVGPVPSRRCAVPRCGNPSLTHVHSILPDTARKLQALGGAADDLGLRKAFGQVRNYVAHVPGTLPPFVMVVDVARTAIVRDRWTGAYGDC